MAVSDGSLVTFAGWPMGLDNISNEAKVKPKALREATNVDIGRGGELHRRKGYTLRLAGTAVHSLEQVGGVLLFVDGAALKRLDSTTWTATTLLTGLTAGARMSYEAVNGYVFFTNGYEIGQYNLTTGAASLFIGVPAPGGQPVCTPLAYGGMVGGQYQVAATFLDVNGMESGSTEAQTVIVATGGGIQLASVPTHAAIAKVRVYLSNPNGAKEELFQHTDLAAGTASAVLGSRILGAPLKTQFLEPLPAGQIIRRFHGRLFVAVGATLVYSDALRFHLYAPDDNYLMFPSRITAVESVEGGLFVAADQLYFLDGADPKTAKLVGTYPATIAEGSSKRVPGTIFPALQTSREVAYFYSSRGPLVGLPDGNAVLPLENRVAGDMQPYGATLLREQEGMRQLVTSLQGTPEASGFRASDYSTLEIRRNGVSEHVITGTGALVAQNAGL